MMPRFAIDTDYATKIKYDCLYYIENVGFGSWDVNCEELKNPAKILLVIG